MTPPVSEIPMPPESDVGIDAREILKKAFQPAETSIQEAIRSELRKLVDGEVFGIAELHRISSVAAQSKSLLQALSPELGKFAKPPPTMPMPISLPSEVVFGSGPAYGSGLAETPNVNLDSIVTSSQTENFGTKAMREIVSIFAERMKPKEANGGGGIWDTDLDRVMEALVTARKNGLDDIADRLEAKIRQKLAVDDWQPLVVGPNKLGGTNGKPSLPLTVETASLYLPNAEEKSP